MVGTILYQLTRSMTPEQIKRSGYDTYFVDHTAGVFPQFASGTPWTAATIGVTGDVIADLSEDMSAEQKARKTYDNILRLCDDPDVTDVIRFLREREGALSALRRGAAAGHGKDGPEKRLCGQPRVRPYLSVDSVSIKHKSSAFCRGLMLRGR